MTNYSAKGGPFFERNAGVPKDPINAGPGGEQFYGTQPSAGISDKEVVIGAPGSYINSNGVTAGQAGPMGKSGGLSADGDMANWKPTDPFTSYNSDKKTN